MSGPVSTKPTMSELTTLVSRSCSGDVTEEYMDRVREQAASLRTAIEAGEYDNPEYAVGLEMELYGTDRDPPSRLAPLPEAVFEAGATKELGVHNAEINTDPDVLDESGLVAQAERIQSAYRAATEAAAGAGTRLVSDAMWTIPPEAGTEQYLAQTERKDGVVLAANMRTDPRYAAIDNAVIRLAEGDIPLSVPGVDRTFPSILFESLATSIQPHLQIPTAATFPTAYNGAIRTLGPILALSTNAPFLPPDLYTSIEDPLKLVERSHHELRIAVFEQSVNASPNPKVRVPNDIETVEETVDRVVADDLYAPFLREWITDEPRDSVADRYWEFQYKRSTYWRWLRCVICGDPVGGGDERSLRIEYRPIPTQPTVADVVGMQWLTVGLIRGLLATDHPLETLPWADARGSFYNAARDGLDADLVWMTRTGERTTDSEIIFEEVFDVAREGLAASGVSEETIDQWLGPIERRWTTRTTPSQWKKEQVREHLAAGSDLAGAITQMQERYIELSEQEAVFADWL